MTLAMYSPSGLTQSERNGKVQGQQAQRLAGHSEFLRLEHGVQQVDEQSQRQQPAHDVCGAHESLPRREIAHAIQCEAA